MPIYFPLALSLEGRRCVVVGGGEVASRRTASLREAGARVIVVAPTICDSLQSLSERREIDVELVHYRSGSIEGAFLVIAATGESDVNAAVVEDARRLGILVCDAADSERGDFV